MINKYLDDIEAVQADLQSGNPSLVDHGLETMARMMADLAKLAPEGRMRDFVLKQRDEALTAQREWREAADRPNYALDTQGSAP